MITVNLHPARKRKRVGSPLSRVLQGVHEFRGKVKDPLLLAVAASWIVVVGWLGFVYLSTARELGALEPRLEETRAEHRRFKTFLAEKRRQEVIRDSLLAQIKTIRVVDGDRYVWPHLLDEVAKALPPYTWLVNLGVSAAAPAAATTPADSATAAAPAVQFELDGRTVDIQAYTRFLRQLEASPWIENVMPVSVQTVVEKERAVNAFMIRATYRQADSAYIRTVSLSHSVR